MTSVSPPGPGTLPRASETEDGAVARPEVVPGAPSRDAPASDQTGEGASSSPVRSALQAVGSVVAPTTLLTALLFYFGWARTQAQAEYLGLDESIFGLSTQDYVLRSISAMYLPLGVGLVVALLGLMVHGWFHRAVHLAPRAGVTRSRLQALVGAVAATGAAMFAAGLYGAFVQSGGSELLAPLGLSLGITLMGYAAHLFAGFPTPIDRKRGDVPELRWLPALKVTLVVLLISVSLFWAVSDYAVAVGRGRTEQLVAGLARRPDVVVFSAQRLHLDGPGVSEARLDDADSAYRYRYSGLKLLLRSDEKYFLLPSGWSYDDGVTIVVPDGEDVRFEFARPTGRSR